MTVEMVVDQFEWTVQIDNFDAEGKKVGYETVDGAVLVYAGETEDGDFKWDFFEGGVLRTGELDQDDQALIVGEIEARLIERDAEQEGEDGNDG